MKDLRIIIVTWNVEHCLDACLKSLPKACEGINYDVIVVDNASTDGSVQIARAHPVRVIANSDNRGFAKACNQGLVGLDARYALLLNPDTECTSGSLAALVRTADAHPDAGILGPQLLNTDGSIQQSIRRFPRYWDQKGVMLKLHHLFPGWFHPYFARDLQLDQEQNADQVMGACFLIRRELLEQIGGLDERYFIWFEEVDYCRQAVERGWKVRYVPSVHVVHHGGQSFGQIFSFKKQQYFNRSVVTYFRKWGPRSAGWLLWAIQPASLAVAWAVGALGLGGKGSRKVLKRESGSQVIRWSSWLAIIVGIELISWFTIFQNDWNAIACIAAALITLAITIRRPTLGLAIVALELLIGSKGQLLQIWGWPGAVSLREALFIAFFTGWILSRPQLGKLATLLRERWEYLVLAAVLFYAVIRGYALGNGAIVPDANAWVFFLLLIPVLDLAHREGERLKQDALSVLIAGPIWLAIKALGLEYLYAHGYAIVNPPSAIHLWVRRTGVGEITPQPDGVFRVFMQSFIFALPPLFFVTAKCFTTHAKGLWRTVRTGDWVMVAAIITLVLGMSRSMAVGLVAGFGVLVALFLWKHRWGMVPQMAAAAARGVILATISIVLVLLTLIAPPTPANRPDGGSLTDRVTVNDPASNSRRALLDGMTTKIKEHPILGSGFGATVSYQSSDPRVLAQNPSGLYTTYAFEWGWLDHWLKFGIVGLILMIVLVYRIGARLLRADGPEWIRYSAFASLIALIVTHFFTPYLNHPLGIGYLLMLEGWSELNRKK